MFSCDFNPEELPVPPDPGLLLPGQLYASSAAQDVLLVSSSGDAKPEEVGTTDEETISSSFSYAVKPQQAATMRQDEELVSWGAAEREWPGGRIPNGLAFNTDRSTRGDELFAIPSVAPAEDIIEQRRQQQLLLESLLRSPREGGSLLFQQQLRTLARHSQPIGAYEEHCTRLGQVEGHFRSTVQQDQSTLSRERERAAQNATVPPFILRKKAGRQTTQGLTVSDGLQKGAGRQLPHQEVETQTHRDGGACRRWKSEQRAE